MKNLIMQKEIDIPKLFVQVFVIVALVAPLIWFLSAPRAPKEFPKGNIVFQEFVEVTPKYAIGFVNDDGSDVEYIHMPVDSFFGQGGSVPVNPVVSQDGSTMVLEILTALDNKKIVILEAGKAPKICKPGFGKLRPQLIHDDSYILIDADRFSGELIVYDLARCRDSGQEYYAEDFIAGDYVAIYNEDTLGLRVYQGSLSPDGRELAVVASSHITDPRSIGVIDLATKEYQFIDTGIYPSFSPDGEWVAYTGKDGIYVVRKDGSDKRRVVRYENPEYGGAKTISKMEWPPNPSWSPDGNWLVYHKCELEEIELVCIRTENYVIYKVNVHTGEEVKIIEGGLNPYWRK